MTTSSIPSNNHETTSGGQPTQPAKKILHIGDFTDKELMAMDLQPKKK
jgi:hypothetical protein